MTGPATSESGRRLTAGVLAIGAAFVLAFILLRCIHLDADPPRRFGDHTTRELFAEPPAKSHEARSWALFGSFQTNPADNYRFWRSQSPLWVYPLAGFFKVFGVGYPQLRIFSAVYSAMGFGVLLWLAWRYLSSQIAVLFAALMLSDGVYVHYSRVGLLEPAVSTWGALLALALIRSRERPAFIMLALSAFAAAFFTKQAAFCLVPALLLGVFASQWRSPVPSQERRIWLFVSGAFGVALVIACLVYALEADYVRAISYNIQSKLGGTDPLSGRTVKNSEHVWNRLVDGARYAQFLVALPLTGPLALLTVAALGVMAVRQRRFALAELVLAVWFVGACAAVLSLARTGLRFWSLAVLPAALLTAIGTRATVQWAANRLQLPALVPALAAIVVCSQLGLHAQTIRTFIGQPEYAIRDAAAAIEREVGSRRAVIVGQKAPGVVLGTPYLNYYVRNGFNDSPRTLRKLGITHALLGDHRDITRTLLAQAYPNLLSGVQPSVQLELNQATLDLYDVAGRFRKHSAVRRKRGTSPIARAIQPSDD